MTTDELVALDDGAFFEYLDALDHQPDASAQVLTEAWTELQARQARIDARMYEEGAAYGLSREQVDEIRATVHHARGIKKEDSV